MCLRLLIKECNVEPFLNQAVLLYVAIMAVSSPILCRVTSVPAALPARHLSACRPVTSFPCGPPGGSGVRRADRCRRGAAARQPSRAAASGGGAPSAGWMRRRSAARPPTPHGRLAGEYRARAGRGSGGRAPSRADTLAHSPPQHLGCTTDDLT